MINNKEEEINDLQGEIDNNGENPWWPSATTAHKANPDDLRAALKSKQQELGFLKEQLKAAKAKLAAAGDSAAVDDMDTDLLADAKGGKKAAAANQLASMEKNVARLKEEIKNEEEEISDMSGRSESKWKAAHELKKQLNAAEEKLAKAKGAESTGTLLIEGGAQASASNSLALEESVAGLKRKINNKEEEINDLQGEIDNNGENPWWPSATTAHKANPDDLRAALKSKQQELGSLKEQLKAAKEKLSTEKQGDSAAVNDTNTALLA